MPKKMGTNSKAVEARARKDEKKRAEQDRIQKEKEDAYWKDDDKQLLRKAQRKAEQEKKKEETLAKKALKQALYEEEMASIKGPSGGGSSSGPTKVTRAQIATKLESKKIESPKPKVIETPIEENLNRIQVENEARTVDEAIAVLSVADTEFERHPERRVKAAYTAFEEKMLPKYKAENSNLRLSQIKQILKKDWMKSPENPLNQPHVAYNSAIVKK
ncbi:coiled-coil domain-containing protein 124 [Tetranychus urticae]|uniref:Coiled-coil domain-containing protein n=1 Tax=Tetranychus urticae TaxID=32264 RepID=T1KQP6_TETUR|nr:coiled-coil domain-containing protein 124 [Tetranychus urticae]